MPNSVACRFEKRPVIYVIRRGATSRPRGKICRSRAISTPREVSAGLFARGGVVDKDQSPDFEAKAEGNPQGGFLRTFGSLFPREEWRPADLEGILASLSYRELEAGTSLLREGQACSKVPFVLEGVLRVYKTAESGREITLYRIEAGQALHPELGLRLEPRGLPGLGGGRKEKFCGLSLKGADSAPPRRGPQLPGLRPRAVLEAHGRGLRTRRGGGLQEGRREAEALAPRVGGGPSWPSRGRHPPGARLSRR